MTSPRSSTLHFRSGFTMPAVLFVLGMLLLFVLGALLQSSAARETSRTGVAATQAELAMRSGLTVFRHQLQAATANDEYLVVCDDTTTKGLSPHLLYLVRPTTSGSNTQFLHLPLFSVARQPQASATAVPPPTDAVLGGATLAHSRAEISTLPYLQPAQATWIPILDAQGRMIARYAYWSEDLQGKLDATRLGNSDGPGGEHVRATWPCLAPGSDPLALEPNRPSLAQVGLFPLDPDATYSEQRDFGRRLSDLRHLMLSPGSPIYASGHTTLPPRAANLHLSDPLARAAEESLATGLQAYLEQPHIPHASAIDPHARGIVKINLNRLLDASDRPAAVAEMAGHIQRALPNFTDRKGGLSDDYLTALCANALDYADSDSKPTLIPGVPPSRGIDSYPLVSEFLMRFRWENVLTQDGRKVLVLSASTYAELWNPCNLAISGEVRLSYETSYSFSLAANPEVSLSDHSQASPHLPIEDGLRWFPPQTVSLQPNEYRILKFGTVTYEIDAGPESTFIPSPLELRGETYGSSGCGYHLKWNGLLADRARGGIHRNNASLHYPKDTRDYPRQRTRATIPSHSHTRLGSFRNNLGDPRMSWYLHAPQDANRYPDNYSPNRRNIRWGTIYRDDLPEKPKVHGRVMPSEWPDGGHNSPVGPFSWHTTDERVHPDDLRFFPDETSPLRKSQAETAPQRISNAGRFLSPTELGHIHDPILWQCSQPTAANQPWGDVTSTSSPNSDHGGGNTLRIGRPEHPRFLQANSPGMEAWRWLDLFHTGQPNSPMQNTRNGPLVSIAGSINLNTASPPVIRCLVYGSLTMDPAAARRTAEIHDTDMLLAPPTTPWNLSSDEANLTADRITSAVIAKRREAPFLSVAEVLTATDSTGKTVFGDVSHLKNPAQLELSDSAREECFARLHDAATVRSRNFRLWVIGQAMVPQDLDSPEPPSILAESHRCFSLFADPGTRLPDGSINPTSTQIRILNESDF